MPAPRKWTAASLLDRTVLTATGCREWQGDRQKPEGYGRVHFQREGVKVSVLAHRFIWELLHGALPTGRVVRHRCDNPACINPDHLVLGSPGENSRDMVERGRSLRGEKHNMVKLTAEQVATIKSTPNTYGSGRKLARAFGVSATTISAVRSGQNWNKESNP